VRVSALLVRAGRVLLVRQEKGEDRYWLLPGGGLDRGESIETSLARELDEECGLTVSVVQPPLALVQVISPDAGRTRHVLELIYAVAADRGAEPRLANDPVIRELGWFEAEELARLALHPPIADLLETWLGLFAHGPPAAWPPFVDTGVRWAP